MPGITQCHSCLLTVYAVCCMSVPSDVQSRQPKIQLHSASTSEHVRQKLAVFLHLVVYAVDSVIEYSCCFLKGMLKSLMKNITV